MWQLTAGVVDLAGAGGVEAVQAEELRHGDPRLAVGVARPEVVDEAAQRRAAQSAVAAREVVVVVVMADKDKHG